MRASIAIAALVTATLVSGPISSVADDAGKSDKPQFTESFAVEEGELGPTGVNPYLVLQPGHVLVLVGKEDGEDVKLTVTVTSDTKKVAGVETRVVEEREEEGGALKEVSRNFFAISKRTNSVYYFGEEVDIYKAGKIVSHEGAWLAGENGARFGLMMAGTPLLGARYMQEIAPGVALDRAEIVDLSASIETPFGALKGCLATDESSGLEPGHERKVYAPGIGLVSDGALRLQKCTPAK